MKIYKYVLNPNKINEPQYIRIPGRANMLAAGVQHSDASAIPSIVVWAEVDESAPPATRLFYIAFTGAATPAGPAWQYLNTVQVSGYVLHIYYEM